MQSDWKYRLWGDEFVPIVFESKNPRAKIDDFQEAAICALAPIQYDDLLDRYVDVQSPEGKVKRMRVSCKRMYSFTAEPVTE